MIRSVSWFFVCWWRVFRPCLKVVHMRLWAVHINRRKMLFQDSYLLSLTFKHFKDGRKNSRKLTREMSCSLIAIWFQGDFFLRPKSRLKILIDCGNDVLPQMIDAKFLCGKRWLIQKAQQSNLLGTRYFSQGSFNIERALEGILACMADHGVRILHTKEGQLHKEKLKPCHEILDWEHNDFR